MITDLSVSHKFNRENYFSLNYLKARYWCINQYDEPIIPMCFSPTVQVSYVTVEHQSVSESPCHSITLTWLPHSLFLFRRYTL